MNLLTDLTITQLYRKLQSKASKCVNGSAKILEFKVHEIIDMVGDGNCRYSGLPFDGIEDATFERINPNLDYVPGNVIMVKRQANCVKSGLDAFAKNKIIPLDVKIKLMRKALYQMEKEHRGKTVNASKADQASATA